MSDKIDWATSRHLLWSNPNPSVNFDTQTVQTGDLTKYAWILILVKTHTSQNYTKAVIVRPEDGGASLDFANNSNTADRNAQLGSDSVTFSAARLNATTDNSRCIPLAIYGID